MVRKAGEEAMDGIGKAGGTEGYIWLRYATQYTLDGRTHTIEMGIPVPLGASAETRERLIREAQVGMDQLAGHVEQHASRLARRQAGQGTAPPAKAPNAAPPRAAVAAVVSTITPAAGPTGQPQPARERVQGAPAPGQAPAAGQSKEPAATHQNIPATTPPGQIDSSGSMAISQFLQYIKDNLRLDARRAMEMLKVKRLSGLNLREALEQLQRMVDQEASGESTIAPVEEKQREGHLQGNQPGAASGESRSSSAPAPAAPSPAPAPLTSPASPRSVPAPVAQAQPVSNIPGIKEISGVVREVHAPLSFDEEVDIEGDEELDFDEGEFLPELSDQDRELAESILPRLRAARGSALASPQRLQVLNNVLGEQLTEEQLQLLLQGVWEAPNPRRLKNDQLETLISWAKEDDFVIEAEVVLAYLQDEDYARSDR